MLRHECEQPPLFTRHSSISSHECPSGANWVPGMSSQLHRYEPRVFKQAPWHGPWPLRNEHSLTSEERPMRIIIVPVKHHDPYSPIATFLLAGEQEY